MKKVAIVARKRPAITNRKALRYIVRLYIGVPSVVTIPFLKKSKSLPRRGWKIKPLDMTNAFKNPADVHPNSAGTRSYAIAKANVFDPAQVPPINIIIMHV